MKAKWHLLVILSGAALFYLAYSQSSTGFYWYHFPLLFPVGIGALFGNGSHDVNEVAVHVAWGVECLFVGLLADVAVLSVIRWKRRKIISDEKNA
jgi:hypothetical protein